MKLYRVTFNYQGELHIYYSHANGEGKAKRNCLRRLTTALNRVIGSLNNYFYSDKPNIKIEEVKK